MNTPSVRDCLVASLPAGAIAARYDKSNHVRPIVVLMTPRSGSSWLADVMAKTGRLGAPEEYASYFFLPQANAKLCAAEEIEYLNGLLSRRGTPNGIFSMNIAWGDIERFSTIDFFEYFSGASFVYLRRRSLLNQAISLMLAVNTGVFHLRDGRAVGSDHYSKVKARGLSRAPSDAGVQTDVMKWAAHIVNYECQLELQLAIRGIKPLRIYYEDLPETMQRVIRNIAATAGVRVDDVTTTASSLSRTRTALNEEIREAFMPARPEFGVVMGALRPPLFD